MKLTASLLVLSSAATIAATFSPSIESVSADIYLHYPPGSNNRLNENTRNVANNARLFDSQDNNRGGYLQGSENAPLSFIAGSQVPIQWTTQHACGNDQDNCDLILQYMVGDGVQAGTNNVRALRDGTATTTMPANGDADAQYGRHESRAYYDECKNTVRNTGLFVADQAMNNAVGRTATRQNSNGNQRGNECAEERDYYPTVIPNPWVDAAILTNNLARCGDYTTKSLNVAATAKCTGVAGANVPITAAACTAKGGQWTTVAAKGLAAPPCILNTQSSRDNSLSVVAGANGTQATYMWTIPQDAAGKDVVFRIRYNISTGEFYDPATGAPEFASATVKDLIDSRYNAKAAGAVTAIPIWEKLKLTKAEVQATINAGNAAAAKAAAKNPTAATTTRGYVVSNNPNVDMFGALLNNGNAVTGVGKVRVQLAHNLAQWGRTFEDRSHVFQVVAPTGVAATALAAGNKILNVGIMGHRGNSQQTYPAIELQFTQKQYDAKPGDVVQFQWSLSKNNPAANAIGADGITGQAAGVDQANVVMTADPTYARLNSIEGGNPFQFGAMGRMQPASITDPAESFLGLSADKLKGLAVGGIKYNSGPILISKEGDFSFMSTMSSIANVRTSKAILSVQGASYASFKNSAVHQAAQAKLQSAVALSAPVDHEVRVSQLSAQTPSSLNPYATLAAQSQAGIVTANTSGNGTNVGLIVGIIAGIAVAILIAVIAFTCYRRSSTGSSSGKQQPAVAQTYQVHSSKPGQMTPPRTASFHPAGVQQQSLPVMKQQQPTAQAFNQDRARIASQYV